MPRCAFVRFAGNFRRFGGCSKGAITLAVVQALEAIQPNFISRPEAGRRRALAAAGLAAILLGAVGVLFASTAPDGIERLTHFDSLALRTPWLHKALAGLGGLALVYAVCLVIGRVVARRSAWLVHRHPGRSNRVRGETDCATFCWKAGAAARARCTAAIRALSPPRLAVFLVAVATAHSALPALAAAWFLLLAAAIVCARLPLAADAPARRHRALVRRCFRDFELAGRRPGRAPSRCF